MPRAIIAIVASFFLAWAAPGAAQEDASLVGEARGLFEAGASAYEGGRYEEALRYFQRSYELSGRPALLYNIGTAAERARQDELALRSYEEYLERVPDADVRPRVETRIAALREQLARSTSGTRADASTSSRSAGGVDPVPWIVLGTGAAVAVAGAILLGVGLSDRATVEDAPDGAIWSEGAAEAYERGPALLTSGIVLLPAGVALAAIGLVWALLAPSGERVAIRVGPGTIQLAGGF